MMVPSVASPCLLPPQLQAGLPGSPGIVCPGAAASSGVAFTPHDMQELAAQALSGGTDASAIGRAVRPPRSSPEVSVHAPAEGPAYEAEAADSETTAGTMLRMALSRR